MAVVFEFEFEKAAASLAYLAAAAEKKRVLGFDKYKAVKLLFLAEKYHLVKYGRPIFGDHYRALPFGPVPQTVLDLLHEIIETPTSERGKQLAGLLNVDRRFTHPRFSLKVEQLDRDALSRSDEEALDHVIEEHGRKSFDELKALTHEMPSFKRARGWASLFQKGAGGMNIEDFFEEDHDAVEGAKEEMLEDHTLRKAFPGPQRG